MRLYKSDANLIPVKDIVYSKVSSAVHLNGGTRNWFRTTVGVIQGSLLSQILISFWSIGGKTIANLCFADEIEGLAGKEEEIQL